jgi:outer membrane protein assembly factor BamB
MSRVVTFALVFGLSGTARAAAAGIRLSPTVGPPTSRVTVSGRGFQASESVEIDFDARMIGSASTSGTGSFLAKVVIPKSAVPGAHSVIAIGLSSGSTASASFTVRTDWTKFRFDAAGTGRNPYENVLSRGNVTGLTLQWSQQVGRVVSAPAVVGGTVYIGVLGTGPAEADVLALDAETGIILWKQVTEGLVTSDPTVWNGLVFVGTLYDHTIRAFDASTGNLLWSFVGAGAMNSPVIWRGRLYVAANSGIVYALDPLTGAELWEKTVSILGISANSVAVAAGLLYTGANDKYLYALNADSGDIIWSSLTGLQISSSPTVDGGAVYVGSTDHNLYAFDSTNGVLKWLATTGGNVDSSPAVSDDLVYVESADGKIYAFDTATGETKWTVDTHAEGTFASPVVANGVVYVGAGDSRVYAINSQTGRVLWTYQAGAIFNDAAAVADGVLRVGSFDDNLYAFALPGNGP